MEFSKLFRSLKSLQMVSAWSSSHQLVLGQVALDQKSNEMRRVRADRRLRPTTERLCLRAIPVLVELSNGLD